MRGAGLPSPSYILEELAQARMALADMKAEHMPVANLADADVLRMLNNAGA
jgi:hypothetical protein